MRAQFVRKIGGDSLTLSKCSEIEIIDDEDTGGYIYELRCVTKRPADISLIDYATVELKVTDESQTILEGDFRVHDTIFPKHLMRSTSVTFEDAVKIQLTPVSGYPQLCNELESEEFYK